MTASRGIRPRPGALPEDTAYRDTGCDLSSSCLRCPLELCRYDMEVRPNVQEARKRGEAVRLLDAEGLSAREIAERTGYSVRRVFGLRREYRGNS